MLFRRWSLLGHRVSFTGDSPPHFKHPDKLAAKLYLSNNVAKSTSFNFNNDTTAFLPKTDNPV